MRNIRFSILTAVLVQLLAILNPVSPTAMVLQEVPARAEGEEIGRVLPEYDTAAEEILLRKDTQVTIVFAQELSSKHATIDEKVELRVAEDVMADNRLAIPKGARVIGTVTTGKKNEKYGNSKTLAVRIDYIVLKDKQIPLTGVREQKPDTNIGAAAASTVGLGISGLLIYMNQREAWIHEGTRIVGYIAEDVMIQR